MATLFDVFANRSARDAVLSVLPLRLRWLLRCTCRQFRRFFLASDLLRLAGLGEHAGRAAETALAQFSWFVGLPPFSHDLSFFPKFRVRGAVARLAQGALRSLAVEKWVDGLRIVAKVQPSVSWSLPAHMIFFSFFFQEDRLEYLWCGCRNG